MNHFGLVKSFDIDRGELNGLTPQQCFVLGYELAQIDDLVKLDNGFSRPVHMENKQRIDKTCKEASRHYSLSWMDDDQSESWLQLEVFPK